MAPELDVVELLEKTLNEKIVSLRELPQLLSTNDQTALSAMDNLRKEKKAYRLGDDKFIGRQFLCKLILKDMKKNKNIFDLKIDNRVISPHILHKMLEVMESDGLIKKFYEQYLVVFEKILTEESIQNFFCQRIDQIKIEEVTEYFGFNSVNTPVPKKKVYSNEYRHCQQIVNQLLAKKILIKNSEDSFSWADV